MFQSPSLRGSGRFAVAGDPALHGVAEFQSPSLRGSGRFRKELTAASDEEVRVSIPFIAGQWSLLPSAVVGCRRRVMFQSPSLRGSGRFAW